jgi:hypothetical protein
VVAVACASVGTWGASQSPWHGRATGTGQQPARSPPRLQPGISVTRDGENHSELAATQLAERARPGRQDRGLVPTTGAQALAHGGRSRSPEGRRSTSVSRSSRKRGAARSVSVGCAPAGASSRKETSLTGTLDVETERLTGGSDLRRSRRHGLSPAYLPLADVGPR